MGNKYLEPEPVKKGPAPQHWIHHGSSLDQSNATFKDKLNTWLKIDLKKTTTFVTRCCGFMSWVPMQFTTVSIVVTSSSCAMSFCGLGG